MGFRVFWCFEHGWTRDILHGFMSLRVYVFSFNSGIVYFYSYNSLYT